MKRYNISVLLHRVCITVMVTLLSVACTDERLISSGELGIPVKVSFEIKMPATMSSQQTPTSRATTVSASATTAIASKSKSFTITQIPDIAASDTVVPSTRASGTQKLYNLWVFQFGQDGAKRKVIKMSDTPEPIKDLIVIDVELLSGTNQTLYLVALGTEYAEIDLNSVGTKDDLEAFTLPAFKDDDTPIITADEQMPYCGSYNGLTIAEDANGRGYLRFSDNIPFTGGIPMNAMLARVTLDFAFQVSDATEQTLYVNNMAKSYPIKPSATYKPTDFNTLSIKLDPATGRNPEGRYQFVWYLAPNPQGKVPTIKKQEERVHASNFFHATTPGVLVGDAPEAGSHLTIWAKHKSENRYILYYLFLGTNLTDDFNVWPGSAYTLRTDIDTYDSPDDLRIISAPLTQSLFFRSSEKKASPDAAWLKINGDKNLGDVKYDLDVHPSRRPIELFVLSGTVEIEVTSGSNWLHLSAYPNYTAAKQAALAGKSDGLTNKISVYSKIPTYYKFYLYADEYKNYIVGDITSSNFKRKANLKFDIATLDGTGTKSLTTYINQRSGFLVGRVGGTFNDNTGEYSDYLAFEAVSEYFEHPNSTKANQYCDYLPYYPKQASMSFVFYDADPISWTYAVKKANYDVGNLYSGKRATRLMAEGKTGTLWTEYYWEYVKKTETPKWTNGTLDLYQYQDNYFKPAGGFSFRACFDRNRDDNGNGVIDPDEYHWYTPAFSQFHIATTYNRRAQTTYTNANFVNLTSTTSLNGLMSMGPDFTRSDGESSRIARCVRDLPVSTPNAASSPQQPKVETVTNSDDGLAYVAIDASALRVGNQLTNYTNYDKVNGTQKDKFVYTHATDGVRTARNLAVGGQASEVVSSRFMIAPGDVSTSGMDWAAASGWSNTANANSTGNVTAATGCASYQGRDGTDKAGTWRLPNAMELVMISIYHPVLQKSSSTTGYTGMKAVSYYWTSNEQSVSQAAMVRPYYEDKDKNQEIALALSFNKTKTQDSGARPNNFLVRCIKDLPLP